MVLKGEKNVYGNLKHPSSAIIKLKFQIMSQKKYRVHLINSVQDF